VRLGDFDVVARVAVGGMGEVFRAVRRGDPYGSPVALKVIRADRLADPYFIDMFRAEARVGMLIDHPNIVRVLEFGAADSVPYLVQELVEGVSLLRLIDKRPLEPAVASYVAISVLRGLEYAHCLRDANKRPLRLVHRDVACGNVLVSRTGDIKLTDFGVVKLRGMSLTQVGEEKGNPACMAPEQLVAAGAKRSVDHRADVFAVGVLLYHMLAGDGPFRDVAVWLAQGARLNVDGPLADIIRRAMALDPEQRFDSAAAMARAIAEAVPPAPDAASRLAQRVTESTQTEQPLGALANRILADLLDNELGERDLGATPAVPHQVGRDQNTQTVPTGFAPFNGGETPTPTVPVGLQRMLANHTQTATAPVGVSRVSEDQPTDSIPLELTSDAISLDSGPVISSAFLVPIASSEFVMDTGLRPQRRGLAALPLRWIAIGLALLVGSALITISWAVSDPAATVEEPVQAAETRKPVVSPLRKRGVAARPLAPRPAIAPPAPIAVAAVPAVPAPAPVRSPARASAQPAPAPRAEAQTGLLTFDSEPWSTVYLGRRKIGTTPFVRVSLPAGRQVLSLDVEESGRRREVPVIIVPNADKRVAIRLDQ